MTPIISAAVPERGPRGGRGACLGCRGGPRLAWTRGEVLETLRAIGIEHGGRAPRPYGATDVQERCRTALRGGGRRVARLLGLASHAVRVGGRRAVVIVS